MNQQLRGVGVAMVTPFNKQNKVDYNALEKLCNHLINNGISYLVVQGTTGETPTLAKEEKIEILEFIKGINNKRLPIVLGMGSNNTSALIRELDDFDFNGVSAILSASPYYNKPTQEGVFQHYKAFSEAAPVPVLLYNVPGRTASNLSVNTTLRIANELKNVIGIKEASGNIEQKAAIINDRPKDFLVISGDDAQALAECAIGNDGVISVIANALPLEFSHMVKAAFANDYETARREYYKVLKIIDLLFVDGNPAGVKAALHILGICDEHVRLPLVSATRETYKKLEAALKSINAI